MCSLCSPSAVASSLAVTMGSRRDVSGIWAVSSSADDLGDGLFSWRFVPGNDARR